MTVKCDFCGGATDEFHVDLIKKLKSVKIISEKYPNLCSDCYKTYSSVKKLEKFLDENYLTCSSCGNKFTHYEVLFDGNGNTAYCKCKKCNKTFKVEVSSDFCAKINECPPFELSTSISH